MTRQAIGGLVVLALLGGCGGNGNPGNPSGTSGSSGGGSGSVNGQAMSATIDGSRWSAVTVTALRTSSSAGTASNRLAINGTNGFTSYTMVTIGVPAAVGTYQVGALVGATAAVDNIAGTSDAKWDSVTAGPTGTVTVTAITSNTASGTFSFTLQPSSLPATGTKTVTNGTFAVTF